MRVTKIKDLELKPPENTVPRSDTIHVTDLINAIEEDLGRNVYSSSTLSNGDWYRDFGFLWEEALTALFSERMGQRIGEISLDGIYGSPDGIIFSDDGVILEEYKCTWKSMSNDPSDNWRWMMQIKAYCKMLDCKVCRLFVLYVNGNYRDTRGPNPVYYEIEFTEKEIESCWNMLKKKAYEIGLSNIPEEKEIKRKGTSVHEKL